MEGLGGFSPLGAALGDVSHEGLKLSIMNNSKWNGFAKETTALYLLVPIATVALGS
jgi:hypothetical protein